MRKIVILVAVALLVAVAVLLTRSAPEQAGADQQPGGRPLNPAFERALPNEATVIRRIRDGMLEVQQLDAGADGQLHRGTHAKGVCVGGKLEIDDLEKTLADPALALRLKKGLFSRIGAYPVTLRFANASGAIEPDGKGDVRAVSLAVSTPPDLSNAQGRMDFTLNDFPVFPIRDAQAFADLMILPEMQALLKKENFAPRQLPSTLKKMAEVWGQFDPSSFGEAVTRAKNLRAAFRVGAEQTSAPDAPHPLSPYQKLTYWSDTPFALGPDEAVKYVLLPCPDNPVQPLAQSSDALSRELRRHVEEDGTMSCFSFQIQVLGLNAPAETPERNKSDWVEDSLTEWPFEPIAVGRLTLTPHSALPPDACEARRVDVTANSSEIHRGLGSINRARASAEAASAERRGGH